MGGDDSQKLLPWRGSYSSPGRKPPAYSKINTLTDNCGGDTVGANPLYNQRLRNQTQANHAAPATITATVTQNNSY